MKIPTCEKCGHIQPTQAAPLLGEESAALIVQGQFVQLVRDLVAGMPAEHKLELAKSLVTNVICHGTDGTFWPLIRQDMQGFWELASPEQLAKVTDRIVDAAERALATQDRYNDTQYLRAFMAAATERWQAEVATALNLRTGLKALAPENGKL